MRPPRLAAGCLAVAALVIGTACGDSFGLLPARIPNVVDSLEQLFALTGTPPSTPSGYRLDLGLQVRTDQSTSFDFAFDIDTAGRAVLLPTGALRLGRASGVQITGTPFDSIKLAPDRGYQLDSAVVVAAGVIALVHSRPTTACGFSTVYYAKLEVLAVDSAARRLDFKILDNQNCGYRGLEPGLPRR